MEEVIEKLESQGKNTLAKIIRDYGETDIDKYSENIWKYTNKFIIEEELINAFKIEFKRVGINESKWNNIISSIRKYKTIQTATHIGLLDSTSVPAFAIHSIALRKIPEDAYYIVGAFSGIPFSNDSYPGAISWKLENDFNQIIDTQSEYYNIFKKRQKDRLRDVKDEIFNRISLYENDSKNDLVYRSETPNTFKKVYPYLNDSIKKYLKYSEAEKDFTKIMLNSCQDFSQKLFDNKKIIYIDINEVVTNYLLLVLKNKHHFIYKMFFNKDINKKIIDKWSKDTSFFYDVVNFKNSKKQVSAYIDGFMLKNQVTEERITPEDLIKKLKKERLCPGTFVVFTALAFLNGLQCLGSFKQVGYLTKYKEKWLEIDLLPQNVLEVKTDALTTGIIPSKKMQYLTAIDIILGDSFDYKKDIKILNDLIIPIKEKLINFKA